MLKPFGILAILWLVCVPPVCLAQGPQAAAPDPEETLVLPFILQSSHVIIVVEVNGQPMRALLDTGGEVSQVNSKRTKGFRPSAERVKAIRENGRVEIHPQWAGHLCLTATVCRNVSLVEHSGPVLGATVDALVGADFLAQFARVTVDYEAFTVTFAFHRPREVLAEK